MKRIHFIGIGGIGMSALASIFLAKGNKVTGSDLRPNNLTDQLSKQGAIISEGHASSNLPNDAALVVRSACIRDENPEVLKAKEKDIRIITRSEMLKDLVEGFPLSISVTGTHGKTTTSSLLSHILEVCEKDPTVLIGGEIPIFNGNAKMGSSNMIVTEVDESDGFFKNISSKYAVITNLEREHIENYGSFDNLVNSYREFIGRIPDDGCLIYNGEDTLLKGISGDYKIRKISFGMDGDYDIKCLNCSYSKNIEFDLVVRGEEIGRIKSSLIGRYNIMNILAAISICVEFGVDIEKIAYAVNSFSGVRRRFDLIEKIDDVEIYEDYAHHPTELKAVISAAKDYAEGRVIAIFQPHRYSRTNDMLDDFVNCFYDADVLILTDIYSADEDIIEGVGIEGVYNKIDKDRFQKMELAKKESIPELIAGIVKDKDTVLILGAGDIREISDELIFQIKSKRDYVK